RELLRQRPGGPGSHAVQEASAAVAHAVVLNQRAALVQSRVAKRAVLVGEVRLG
ncbi:unnamed protein product, partial [Amoebophrya sp. A120]